MQNRGYAVGAVGVAIATAWLPVPAHACSCSPETLHKFGAIPQDGALNVPLNAAARIGGAFKSGSIAVEDGAGQPIAVTIHEAPFGGPCGGTWAEVIPLKPWAAQTTYRIRVTSLFPESAKPGDDVLTFTTGNALLPDPELAMPKAHVSLMRDLPGTSCGPTPVVACIDVGELASDRSDVEVIARRDGRVLLRAFTQGPDGTLELDAIPDCMEFRRRAPTGKRSEPLIVCDSPSSKYEDPGTLDWPTCRGGEFFNTESAGTCSAEPGRPTRGASIWLWLGLALVAWNQRRRA